MTLSTLDTERKKVIKTAFVYAAVTVFCAFFGAVYELFSHGIYSYYMIYAFGFSLVGGVLPSLISLCRKEVKIHGIYSRYFYRSAIAVFTVGSIFRGVLDIYGTTSRLSAVYPAAGLLLLILSAVTFFIKDSGEEGKSEEISQ